MIKKLILSIFVIAFFTVSSFSQNRTLPSVKVKNLKGSLVNIEIDILSKYVKNFFNAKK